MKMCPKKIPIVLKKHVILFDNNRDAQLSIAVKLFPVVTKRPLLTNGLLRHHVSLLLIDFYSYGLFEQWWFTVTRDPLKKFQHRFTLDIATTKIL